MVRSYNEYLRLLETAVIRNGKKALSDYQIEQFIKWNSLDSDWHIITSDVKKDMLPIVKRYAQIKQVVQPKPMPQAKSSGTGSKVKEYGEYLRLLENAIVQNGKKELKQNQIEEFIRLNNLDSDWGIVSSEVKKDMESILIKYRVYIKNTPKSVTYPKKPNIGCNIGRIASSDAKHIGVQTEVSLSQNNEKCSNIQNNDKKKSGLTEDDKNVVLLLRDTLREHPEITANGKRLKVAIADILPGKKKEVNLLGTLAEANIIRAIETQKSLDKVLCNSFS